MVALPVSERPGVSEGACSTGGCNPNGKCGNGLEKIYPTCAVRYGYMRYIGEFRYAPGMLFGCGQKVVIQTNRGIEMGDQVSLTCTGCDKSVSRQQMQKYVKASGPEYLRFKAGKILRAAGDQDLSEEVKLNQEAARELDRARELTRELKLPMKLVCCEHLFGGERVIFHFMSQDRIDFRDLVKGLAHEFHTRIEMHQVGARDEARLVADYEICGRECCCKNFLKKLRPVAMRMAKLQKATLDPSKVSGRCGRLRCCLRYEQDGYEGLDKKLPKVGARIRTGEGLGTVTDRQILTQLLTVSFDQGEQQTIVIEDVLETIPKGDPREIRTAPEVSRIVRGRPQRPTGRRTDSPPNRGHGDAAPKPAQTPAPRVDQTARPAPPAKVEVTPKSEPPERDQASEGTERSNQSGEARGDAPGRRGRRRRRRGRGRNRGSEQSQGSSNSGDSPGPSQDGGKRPSDGPPPDSR